MAKTKEITPRDIEAQIFIEALAKKLEGMKEFAIPEWAAYIKTGASKQRPPERDDWWYVRAASILRTLYIKGVIGVERLRTKYGSRKKRGVRPEKYFKSSGKIIRVVLQKATAEGLVEIIKEKKTGRRLTKKGKEFLESVAQEIKQR